ncbi:hypothetical protein BJ944DRAFT_229690 [Cunninghamella echinulata]|nr:hypothetical protein BJ944DRAFT_229690 [Cunninghamella echinulata]
MHSKKLDYRQKGPLMGYSTQHSEHMHSTKVKKSARRTNFWNTSATAQQAASYIEIKDVIVDNYRESDHDMEPPPDNANYSLQSFVKEAKSMKDVVIQLFMEKTVLKKSDSLFICFVKDINHLAFVVPDFPSRLVNHDINVHSFMEAMDNQLLTVPSYRLVKWKYKIVEESENDDDYVESEEEDDRGREEANNDEDDEDDEDDETEGEEEVY